MKKLDINKDYFPFPDNLDRSLYHLFDALQLAYLHPKFKQLFDYPFGLRKVEDNLSLII